jgi:hypothetical protein
MKKYMLLRHCERSAAISRQTLRDCFVAPKVFGAPRNDA